MPKLFVVLHLVKSRVSPVTQATDKPLFLSVRYRYSKCCCSGGNLLSA